MRPRALILVVALLAAPACRADLPREREQARVAQLAVPFIEQRWARSIVIGLVDSTGPRVYAFGALTGDPHSPAPDAKMIYEIASLTKPFTATVLADLVFRRQLALEDPVSKFLPTGVSMPPTDRTMTLLLLATHHSGLRRMPWNLRPRDPLNPYADYDADRLYEYLSRAPLRPTKDYEYSNVGYALLGHALSRAAGEPYEKLVIDRVCAPLGMTDTKIALTDADRARLAPPFDADLEPDANWDFADLPGACGLRSTADDMLKWVAAQAGLAGKAPPGLAVAIHQTQVTRESGPGPEIRIGLGWHVNFRDGSLFHTGQSGGYHAFVGVDRDAKAGVVLLANTATARLDALAVQSFRVMTGRPIQPITLPAVAQLDGKILDDCAGRYALDDGRGAFLVQRDGDRLITSARGQKGARIYPSSESDFFAKSSDATASFERGADGAVVAVVIRRDGREVRATRGK
jgi:CubicO group peptidase (beta-lactamase class C family)